MGNQPWASGPKEILQHGLRLLKKNTDVSRRLSILSIDNAVELTIKTFLGLPKRINGISISRRQFAEISESFPKLIDALEEHGNELLEGIDLGEIEWFHRLRNQLYHQGNGLTVDRDKVEIYAELAQLLFKNLFGEELEIKEDDEQKLLGMFLETWVNFEKVVANLSQKNIEKMSTLQGRPRPPFQAIRELVRLGVFSEEDSIEIQKQRELRNKVVHGIVDHREVLSEELISKLKVITEKYAT